MFTSVTSIEELKQIFSEILFNKTNKVTKIADQSVLNGIAYGVSKVAQKAIKDIAIVESHLLPESAFGEHLDLIAERLGISPRFQESGSSSYLRVVATPGTIYTAGINSFNSSTGIIFDLEETTIIGDIGFSYLKIRSQNTGLKTNVDALSINKVSPSPLGHSYCINEYQAIGGRDLESDELFLKRIKEGPNILAQKTLNYILQVFLKFNPNILRVFYQGSDSTGKNVLALTTHNGISLTQKELSQLLINSQDYFSLSELKYYSEEFKGLKLINMQFFPVDISMRVQIEDGENSDIVRKNIQLRIQKILDYRFWTSTQKVQWDDLLLIAKTTKGVSYIDDSNFSPRIDLVVPKNQLPRVRGFLMLDLNGNIISDALGNLSPIYYPTKVDFNFQATVLSQL